MKRRNYKGRELLPLAVSDAAQAGDADAVEQVLRYYEGYINKLCTALVGVLALIQRCQQRIEHPVVALEYLIQKADIRLGNFAGSVDLGLAGVKNSHARAVNLQFLRRLFD